MYASKPNNSKNNYDDDDDDKNTLEMKTKQRHSMWQKTEVFTKERAMDCWIVRFIFHMTHDKNVLDFVSSIFLFLILCAPDHAASAATAAPAAVVVVVNWNAGFSHFRLVRSVNIVIIDRKLFQNQKNF